jgi:uncharacterized membrane protein YfcA
MIAADTLTLSALIGLAAIVYSSVGHGGASGYIAAMALMDVAPEVMKPTALTLNILVAGLASIRLYRAGLVGVRALAPFLLGSVPFAFVGGAIALPIPVYKSLVGLVLVGAALRFLVETKERRVFGDEPAAPPPLWPAIGIGAAIGLLSGLTGVGGGIFLSPLVLILGWAGARQTAGLSAPFIVVNSVAGLGGNFLSLQALPGELPLYALTAFVGAWIGTHFTLRWFSPLAIRRVLGLVLLVAGGKFVLT